MSELEGCCQWHFCKDDDQFNFGVGATPQRNFRKASLAASIVRESIQNSIDAAELFPVRVEYTKRELCVNDYPSLFGLDKCSDEKSLESHFKGMKDSITENDVQNSEEYEKKLKYVSGFKDGALWGVRVPYLRISDYNTAGMEYQKDGNKGTFASFVRSIGKNDKRTRSSAGSNGVGKGAYIQLSQFNTLLVSSRSKDQTLFEGNMLMVSHYVDGQAYHPYAFYDCNGGKPVDDINSIPRDFLREKIGTDINIIGIDDSNWGNQVTAMIEAVLKNFWLAIHSGRLEVVIEDTVIDKNSLPDLLEEHFGTQKDGSQERTYNPLTYYQIVAHEETDKIKHIRKTLPLIGDVEFYLNKAKTGNGRILYMRDSRMLIYSKVEPMYNQINGVFVCTGVKGNEILKEAENEAHNEWKAKSGDTTAKEAIKIIEKFIKDCLEEELGSATNGTVDIKGLAKRLPITTEPVFDEDYEDELDLDDSGNTVTETAETTEAGMIKPLREKKESVSRVHVRKKKKVEPDQTGDEFEESQTGDGPEIPSTYDPIPEPPNPSPYPPFPGPDPNVDINTGSTSNGNSSNGTEKKTVSINSFEPWAFAHKVNGVYVYDVRIKCAKEHENANIVVTIGGEANDDHIDIEEASLGTPEGHIVKGVHLNKGLTSFSMRFKDNEKVSVKISAYEYKD